MSSEDDSSNKRRRVIPAHRDIRLSSPMLFEGKPPAAFLHLDHAGDVLQPIGSDKTPAPSSAASPADAHSRLLNHGQQRMRLIDSKKTKASKSAAAPSSSKNVLSKDPHKPAMIRQLDDYLAFVGSKYYEPSEAGFSSEQFSLLRRTTYGRLTSPVYRTSVVDRWSPYEIACFESAICLFGKHFHVIQKAVKTKSTKEIIEFYYAWKKSEHYKAWKATYHEQRKVYS